jgi:SAM-dependent methyltransferase
VCEREAPLAAHAAIAPFVAELTGIPRDAPVGYRECASCGLGFFDRRYDDGEMARLYDDYRGADYVRVRRAWEPWYRVDVNDAYLPGSAAIGHRVVFAAAVMGEAGLRGPLRCAVDFGGDQGQFFPEVETARRIVVDVSGKPLIEGIERVESLAELPEPPDLVVVAHVLEHMSDPRQLLAEIGRALAADGFLYVEVPLDRPRVRTWHRGRAYRAWLRLLVRHRRPFQLCDFASGVARQFRRTIPRLGVVKESEHLNFFEPDSMRALLESCGFEVRAERADPRAQTGAFRLGRLGMAAVAAGAPA